MGFRGTGTSAGSEIWWHINSKPAETSRSKPQTSSGGQPVLSRLAAGTRQSAFGEWRGLGFFFLKAKHPDDQQNQHLPQDFSKETKKTTTYATSTFKNAVFKLKQSPFILKCLKTWKQEADCLLCSWLPCCSLLE